jgi:hypothetical protein
MKVRVLQAVKREGLNLPEVKKLREQLSSLGY